MPHFRIMPTVVNPQIRALEASFGDRLRAERKALGHSQESVAQLMDIAVRSIKGYEAGSTTVASDVIYRMMAIGIDVNYLFCGRSREAKARLPKEIDQAALDRAIAWVDGEWGTDDAGQRISDRERIEWILKAYAAMTDETPEREECIPQSAASSRKKKSG